MQKNYIVRTLQFTPPPRNGQFPPARELYLLDEHAPLIDILRWAHHKRLRTVVLGEPPLLFAEEIPQA